MAKHLRNDPEARRVVERCFAQGMSDAQVVAQLDKELKRTWSTETVRRLRKDTNAKPTETGLPQSTAPQSPADDGSVLSTPPSNLTRAQKEDWFRVRFKNSHMFPLLQSQMTTAEVEVYLQEFGEICAQFEDIVSSEFYQIDDFLKHRILINRQMTAMKTLQEEIVELQQWFINNPPEGEDDDDKEAKKRRVGQMRALDAKRQSLNAANDRYDKLTRERRTTYEHLAATRKDRIAEIKGGGDSFFALVSELTTSEAARAKHGKYAELTRLAGQDVQDEFRKPTEFPDGETDFVIYDEGVEAPDAEAQQEEEGCSEG